MARNNLRRASLVDAGLAVLAREGSRGLTHRAIDQEAEVPLGTCGNYLSTRDALFHAMGERIFERLTPTRQQLNRSANVQPVQARVVVLVQELMDRVLAQPELHLALLELRLESTRRPELEEGLTRTLQRALQFDLEYHEEAKLPGGRREVTLLHLAISGLILHTLTLPRVLDIKDTSEMVKVIVNAIYSEGSS